MFQSNAGLVIYALGSVCVVSEIVVLFRIFSLVFLTVSLNSTYKQFQPSFVFFHLAHVCRIYYLNAKIE